MTQTFTTEFVDAFLFKNGLELKSYIIRRTQFSETISCVSDDSEFDLLISNNELWRLAKLRLIELGVRVVDQRSIKDATPERAARALLLVELLERGGHERHEDIVFELGLIGDPIAVDAIMRAAKQPFSYIEEWGNLHAFQRKCAYALARIGTVESRTALQQLAKDADPYLREYGEEGLEHWPLPFKVG